MPTFRLLVAANATVLHNHKLSCDATTMAELEQAVQQQIGLEIPVWIFMRDPDFDGALVRVANLADLATACTIEVLPQAAATPRPAVAAAATVRRAEGVGDGGAEPRKFMPLQGLHSGFIGGGCETPEGGGTHEDVMPWKDLFADLGSEDTDGGWDGEMAIDLWDSTSSSESSCANYDAAEDSWSDAGVDSGGQLSD
eukprot:COSAG03_NODE_7204_length_949_cov_1.483529_1_plen_196_part_10